MLNFDTATDLEFLLFRQDGVIGRTQALQYFSSSAIRHKLVTGRWRRAHRGVFLTLATELTAAQRRWVALLATGEREPTLLAGLSALETLGLTGIERETVHLLLPAESRAVAPPSYVRVHRTRHLPDEDVWPSAGPPSTNAPRAVVDAAQWASSDREARLVIARSFQRGLVTAGQLLAVLDRMPWVRRRRLISMTAYDADGGAHSLGELDFLSLSRRAGLPEPTLQVPRRDASGRRRYLDVVYEPWGVHVEIDGAHHLDAGVAWDDMRRQNEVWIAGDRVLRFPAWAVRDHPDVVIAQVRSALLAAGWRP